jgi:hypothetical protein
MVKWQGIEGVEQGLTDRGQTLTNKDIRGHHAVFKEKSTTTIKSIKQIVSATKLPCC